METVSGAAQGMARALPMGCHPTGREFPSRANNLVLSKDTKFPESVNKTLNHNLSTPGTKAPKTVSINHLEHL